MYIIYNMIRLNSNIILFLLLPIYLVNYTKFKYFFDNKILGLLIEKEVKLTHIINQFKYFIGFEPNIKKVKIEYYFI